MTETIEINWHAYRNREEQKSMVGVRFLVQDTLSGQLVSPEAQSAPSSDRLH